MKKIIFTIAIAFFAISVNAQDDPAKTKTKVNKEKTTPAKENSANNSSPVNADKSALKQQGPGSSTGESKKVEDSPKEATPKKGATRMAINEKGLPGNSAASSTKKDDKKPATGNK